MGESRMSRACATTCSDGTVASIRVVLVHITVAVASTGAGGGGGGVGQGLPPMLMQPGVAVPGPDVQRAWT